MSGTRAAPKSRKLHLFRALFPSWRFFDSIGWAPTLEVRYGPSPSDLGPWIHPIPKLSRSPWAFWFRNLFLNGNSNLNFAFQGLLYQLVEDENDPPDFPTSSFNLVDALVRSLLPEHLNDTGGFYQFRISAHTFGAQSEILIESERCPLPGGGPSK